MRISDWSSDVCSSDLLLRAAKHQSAVAKHHPPGRQGRPVNTNIRSLKGEDRALDKGNTIRQRRKQLFQPGFLPSDPLQCFVKACSDRKGVVTGKRVSVGVVLGGRRYITKTKNKNNDVR